MSLDIIGVDFVSSPVPMQGQVRTHTVSTRYYSQFDADPSRPFPATGYGGWATADLPINLDATALVVMHAWEAGTADAYPGWYRAVEYLPRANWIAEHVLPPLIDACRQADVPVFHVPGGADYYSHHPGYAHARSLVSPDAEPEHQAVADETYDNLVAFRHHNVFPGDHNDADIRRAFNVIDFNRHVAPGPGETIAATTAELAAVARDAGVNHLVYVGFAINGCLLISPGGMVDMQRLGFLCSTIPAGVTAIENRETVETEEAKAQALWRVALLFGFVYELEPFVEMLRGAADEVA